MQNLRANLWGIDQKIFNIFKLQPKTKDLNMRLWVTTAEFVRFIPQSLVLRSKKREFICS